MQLDGDGPLEPALVLHALGSREIGGALLEQVRAPGDQGFAQYDIRDLGTRLSELQRTDPAAYDTTLRNSRHQRLYEGLAANHSRLTSALVASNQPDTVPEGLRRGDTVEIAPHVAAGLADCTTAVVVCVLGCRLNDPVGLQDALVETLRPVIDDFVREGGGTCYVFGETGSPQLITTLRSVAQAVVPIAVPLQEVSTRRPEPRRLDRELRPVDDRGVASLVLRSFQIGAIDAAARVLESLDGEVAELARSGLEDETRRTDVIELLRGLLG